MPLKLIFLDIDGVLNSDHWERLYVSKKLDFPHSKFDPANVRLLNTIIRRTGCKIVLSSTWRIGRTLDEMRHIFSQVGIKGNLIDFTPELTGKHKALVRGNEILSWCQNNESLLGCSYIDFKDFVIIDDRDDMLLWQAPHFFQTDRLCGLSPTLTQKILRHLA